MILAAILFFSSAKRPHLLPMWVATSLHTKEWNPDNTPPVFGIVALVFGTVLSSAIALLIAVPVALGAALVVVELGTSSRRSAAWLPGRYVGGGAQRCLRTLGHDFSCSLS